MIIHVSPSGQYPAHVHGCPGHPGGSTSSMTWNLRTIYASLTTDGIKRSDACFWDEHDAAYRLLHRASYQLAQITGSSTAPTNDAGSA